MSSRSRRIAAVKASQAIADTADSKDDRPASSSTRMSRPRRGVSDDFPSSATVSRDPPSSPTHKAQLNLHVKMPTNKLRAATGGGSRGIARPIVAGNSRAAREEVMGKRSRNVKKSYVLESSEDEDEEMEDAADEDAEGESVDNEDDDMNADDDEDEDEDEDAEGEEDADGDVDMDIPPPAPIIKVSKAQDKKTAISVKTQPPKKEVKPVEDKEVDGSDDEELSELDSDIEEEEEGMQMGGEEDAEGEDEEIEVVEEDDEEEVEEEVEVEDDDLDSDDETPMGGSRASTPDLSKLTKRQRARLEEGGSGHLLALPDEVQVKKHLTAEEHAMRRAEMARRRKNLSEKRNEEEKMETINKLLKKQAPKTNARRRDLAGLSQDSIADGEPVKPNPIFVRWISNKDGNRVSVPSELLESAAGSVFVQRGLGGGRMLEEVQ